VQENLRNLSKLKEDFDKLNHLQLDTKSWWSTAFTRVNKSGLGGGR
jgi:hypothetical protein